MLTFCYFANGGAMFHAVIPVERGTHIFSWLLLRSRVEVALGFEHAHVRVRIDIFMICSVR